MKKIGETHNLNRKGSMQVRSENVKFVMLQ